MRIEPTNSSRFSSADFLQALDVLFDIAGHFVEVFSQFADFRGPAHRRALMKFAAADSARGSGQATNRSTDANGKKVTNQHGDKITTLTNASAWRLSSVTPASSRACARLRCATTANSTPAKC